MNTFDRTAYEIWKREIVKLAPVHVTCPDCNGSGEGICPHCGNESDCETCNGDGNVTPEEILTPEFYRRVMMFETERLEHWVKGDPIATKDSKGRVIENHNPLNEFLDEYQKPRHLQNSFSKVVLVLPITES